MATMAYLLQLIDDLSGQSVVMWSSILDPAMGAMSEQEVDQRKEMCIGVKFIRCKQFQG